MRATLRLAAIAVGLTVPGILPSLAQQPAPSGSGQPAGQKEEQVVTSKPTQRFPATAVNFKKEFGLPFDSLSTLGARVEQARRKPDPVALAHAASELAVAEQVSKKQASITSKALLAEAAQLAQLRRQAAELKAVYALKQQIANEEGDVARWSKLITQAETTTAQEKAAALQNTEPTNAPRWVRLNNYTTQYLDLWVNGYYRMQVPPGESRWCLLDHRINPTVLTAWGDQDEGGLTNQWRRELWGNFRTYTWNINN